MRNAAALMLALAVIAFLAAIPGRPALAQPVTAPGYWDPSERVGLPDLSSRTRIRFVTTIDFPPFNFLDDNNRITGFHIDLMRAICDQLKVTDRCQLQILPWGELKQSLAEGDADVIAAGMAITAENREALAFTRPFLKLPARFVRTNTTPIGGDDASALSGQRVGVLAKSAHEAMLKAYFPDIVPVAFDRDEPMFEELKNGGIAAVFGDGVRLSFWLGSKEAEACCSFFDGPYLSDAFLGDGLALAVAHDDTDLLTALNHALLALTRNGRMTEIYLRYFPNGLY
jgi:polar amino acid transport system substrate-binding protein